MTAQNFLDFMQFLANFDQIASWHPPGGSAPPPKGILDPPLLRTPMFGGGGMGVKIQFFRKCPCNCEFFGPHNDPLDAYIIGKYNVLTL